MQTPPLLKVIKEKDYKSKYADYDKEPYIVIKNASCAMKLPLITEEDIVGLNALGTIAVLNGAVLPTTAWLHGVFEIGEPQVVEYTTKYPKQSELLAQIQDLLLKESLKIMVNVAKLKAALVLVSPSVKFMNKLKLPTIRVDPPVFSADLVQKYIWAAKKLEIENLDEVLESLGVEGDDVECNGKICKYVTDVYDYSVFVSDLTATPATPATPTTSATPATPVIIQKTTLRKMHNKIKNVTKTLKNKLNIDERKLLKTIAYLDIESTPSTLSKFNTNLIVKHYKSIVNKVSDVLISYMKTMKNANGNTLFETTRNGNLIAWTFRHDDYKYMSEFKNVLAWLEYLNTHYQEDTKQLLIELFPYINALNYVYTEKLSNVKPIILTNLCEKIKCFKPNQPIPEGHWTTTL